MKNKRRYQMRRAAGLYWLLDMEQSGKKSTGAVSFNESGAFIWEQYERLGSDEAVAEKLCENFDLFYEDSLADVRQFLSQLREQGLEI